MVKAVLVGHSTINACSQSIKVSLELVGAGDGFEMEPESLNGIEEGTIGRQPDDHDPIFEEAQSCQGSFALVIGSIVHDQNNPLGWVASEQQMLHESDEGLTILAARALPGQRVIAPIVGAKCV